ncbi:MAG: bacteriohopanetetrol glucosamine biosynthesis glycosyltransferase HpnI [Terriglobales bacterium]
MVFAAIAAVLAICGVGYHLLCLWSASRFVRDSEKIELPDFTPPVSLLKPLRGADPEMYAALRSHCVQDYPDCEIIFGVADAGDPAAAMVKKLKHEFPDQRIELVECPRVLGSNLKVSNLVQMLPSARQPFLLINDSDIRVPSDYLRRIIAPMADSRVGMVTSMYRGVATGLWSKLEAIGISTDFIPGVLAARQLQGMHFALGATLAFPRQRLEEIGGFEPLLDYLADDYELGARIAATGHDVLLSDVVVDTHLPNYSFGGFWRHQMRWARGVRDARKWGYLGLAVTFALPWAVIALLLSKGTTWAWGVLALAALSRMLVSLSVGKRVLQDSRLPRDLWLLPLRDFLALAIWMTSFFGRTVEWRGQRFSLRDGKLVAIR